MKPLHILSILLLSALLCSCSGQRDIQTKLSKADSLMTSSPDSSYSLLKSIDNSRLYSKALKAKYALLYTEAQYKNYEEFESDSLINVAVNYYEKKGERRDYGRSLMYKGAVLYDMMDYNGAIEEYKKAEEVLEPLEEYLLLGLVNTRMSELYSYTYSSDSICIVKDKKAALYFHKAEDIEKENNAYYFIAKSYLINKDKDSALFYLDKSTTISEKLKDTLLLIQNNFLLSCIYFQTNDYHKAKEICLKVFKQYNTHNLNQMLYLLARSYSKLGQIDSAFFYYDKINNNKKALSDMMVRSELEENSGHYEKALQYRMKCYAISDSIMQERNRQQILLVEKRFDYQKVALQNQIIKSRNETQAIVFLSVACVLLLIIIIMVMVVNRNKRELVNKLSFIEQLKSESEVTKNTFVSELSRKNDTEAKLKKLLGDKLSILNQIASISFEYGGRANTEVLVREYNKIMKIGKLDEGVFRDIAEIVNVQCNGILEEIKKDHPELTNDDVYFISLLYCGFSTSAICAFFGYKTQDVAYVRKSRLAKKMKLGVPIDVYISKMADNLNSVKV